MQSLVRLNSPEHPITLTLYRTNVEGELVNLSGGLGLTGGIADVGALQDALVGIHKGLADDSILDKYSEIRSEKYRTITDPISTMNFKRLWSKTPDEIIAEDEFFALLRTASTDKKLMQQLRAVSPCITPGFNWLAC